MPLTPHTLPQKYTPLLPPPPYTHAPPPYILLIKIFIYFEYFPILMTIIVFIFSLRRLGGEQIHHKICLQL